MSEITNYRVVAARDPQFPDDEILDATIKPGKRETSGESDKAQRKLARLMEWLQSERQIQSVNRFQMSLDEDYYDHIQWSEEDAMVLRERHQAPMVYNLIKPTIDWISGTERRTRTDFRVLPRRDDDQSADNKTQLLKYIADVNKSRFPKSRAFDDAIKAGLGWLECAITKDPTEEPLYVRYESWRCLFYDSRAVEPDMRDARYVFREKWIDLDLAQAWFPQKKNALKLLAMGTTFREEQGDDLWYLGGRLEDRDELYQLGRRTYLTDAQVNNRRVRVKLIECWYKVPEKQKVMVGDHSLSGLPFDETDPTHQAIVAAGSVELVDRIALSVRVAIFTEKFLILDLPSPYRHNRFPFIAVWGWRRKRDNAPYGVIRGLRDPQDDFNKRASKALFMLSTNRVIADDDAAPDNDWDGIREEIARPDAFIIKKKGATLEIDNNAPLAEVHIKLMGLAQNIIQRAGGVTDENLGQQTNAKSGKAIERRQEQGTVVTTTLFDNYRLALQTLGEIELALVEQFYSEPKIVRILGPQGQPDFRKLNQPKPDGSLENPITATQADFVITEQDYRATVRQAMAEQLGDMVMKLPPPIAIKLLPIVVALMDLPDKDEILAQLRIIAGTATPDELTPQQAQQFTKAKEDAAQKDALEKGLAQSKIDLNRAKAAESEASATHRATLSQKTAADTAQQLGTQHGAVAQAADGMLASAHASAGVNLNDITDPITGNIAEDNANGIP